MVLGEEDYKLSDDTVLRPDVVLICDEPNEAYITKAPEIVVEIVSKSSARNEKVNRKARDAALGYEHYKFDRYEAEKVNYYILVYPNELYAKAYRLVNGKYDKQGDFSRDSYEFDDTTCGVSIDFDKVFRRFRK